MWHYRELLYFLIWRDIKVRYKQTALGAAWAIIQPFFTMVVFSLFFGRLAKMPSDGVPYPDFQLHRAGAVDVLREWAGLISQQSGRQRQLDLKSLLSAADRAHGHHSVRHCRFCAGVRRADRHDAGLWHHARRAM